MTSGATEALAAAILATVSPGDEVIVMTPAYDAYAPLIRRAGGTVREVALAAARLADRACGAGGGGDREDPGDRLQQSAQSDRAAVRRRRAGGGCGWRATMT